MNLGLKAMSSRNGDKDRTQKLTKGLLATTALLFSAVTGTTYGATTATQLQFPILAKLHQVADLSDEEKIQALKTLGHYYTTYSQVMATPGQTDAAKRMTIDHAYQNLRRDLHRIMTPNEARKWLAFSTRQLRLSRTTAPSIGSPSIGGPAIF